jgi:hypothetical protein
VFNKEVFHIYIYIYEGDSLLRLLADAAWHNLVSPAAQVVVRGMKSAWLMNVRWVAKETAGTTNTSWYSTTRALRSVVRLTALHNSKNHNDKNKMIERQKHSKDGSLSMLQNSDSLNVLTIFVYYATIILDAFRRGTYIWCQYTIFRIWLYSWMVVIILTLVRERTIPTERPPLVSEVSANFWDRRSHVVSVTGR